MDRIDVDKVLHVLLADGWHKVENESFMVGGHGYLWRGPGGDGEPGPLQSADVEAICPVGFEFEEHLPVPGQSGAVHVVRVSGPLTAVLAVRETTH